MATALTAGWTPQRLAGFTGGNITGVRNPYAVLATRMLSFDGDAPRPGPRCKPTAIHSRASPLRRLA